MYKRPIDEIRATEYPYLLDATYLDHGGATLYAKRLIERFSNDLQTHLFGNPHSASPSSALSSSRIDAARAKVLKFFKADEEHFDVVFVANATAAIKLVSEAFRDVTDQRGFSYAYHRDAHTSLVGIREIAKSSRCFNSDAEVEDWLQGDQVGLIDPSGDLSRHLLFAYPGQSNMNGHRPSLSWSARIRSKMEKQVGGKVYTLLDAAALAMTGQIDLSQPDESPDFLAVSFYKIFGFPDLGALIVRKPAADIFEGKRFFGGGTVDMVTAFQTPWHVKKSQTLHDQIEEGTLPFHSIIALEHAIDVHAELFGSMNEISSHTAALSAGLYERLVKLKHWNGKQACKIYTDPGSKYGDPKTQGPTIAFNLLNSRGGWIGKSEVEQLAISKGIQLRSGGVCNPGGIASHCELSYSTMRQNFTEGMRCGDDLDILGGKPTGIVRVSLGAMSCQKDVDFFIEFLEGHFIESDPFSCPYTNGLDLVQAVDNSVIQRLNIFPVLGCQPWQVPKSLPWPILANGSFSLDCEYCVVLLPDNSGKTAELPLARLWKRLKRVSIEFDFRQGMLYFTISHDTTRAGHSQKVRNKAAVCIWDVPQPTDHDCRILYPEMSLIEALGPADPVTSPSIVAFFTAVLGHPATLARFRQRNKVSSPKLQVGDKSGTLTVTSHVNNSALCNVCLAPSAYELSSSKVVRIGGHVFEILDAIQPPFGKTRLSLVQDPFENSNRSQFPTLHVGQKVDFFENADVTSFQRTIAELKTSQCFTCPATQCGAGFETQQALMSHLINPDNHTKRVEQKSKRPQLQSRYSSNHRGSEQVDKIEIIPPQASPATANYNTSPIAKDKRVVVNAFEISWSPSHVSQHPAHNAEPESVIVSAVEDGNASTRDVEFLEKVSNESVIPAIGQTIALKTSRKRRKVIMSYLMTRCFRSVL